MKSDEEEMEIPTREWRRKATLDEIIDDKGRGEAGAACRRTG